VRLDAPDGIAVGRDGAVFIATTETVYRVAPGLPELSDKESLIPSTDGLTLYQFDQQGRHEATIDAMTGVTELTFAYDKNGRLSSLTDKNGLVTTIARTSSGRPTAIVSPFKQTTTLDVQDGLLRSVKDDLGRETKLDYDGDLLTTVTDPKGGQHAYTYEPDTGTLTSVTDPTGYTETLAADASADGYGASITTPENRVSDYQVAVKPGNVLERTFYLPDKTELHFSDALDSRSLDHPDGTSVTTILEPDPTFGAQALFPSSVTTKTPSGKTLTVLGTRTKKLSDINNPLSLEAWDDRFEINDRVYERVYDRKGRTLTTTSPEGRTTATTLDELGRPTDITAPGLPNIHLTYDGSGRVTSRTASADGQDRTEKLGYGKDGFLATFTDPEKNTVSYERDLALRITSLLRPDQSSIDTAFDDNDNVISLTPPGRDPHLFDYQSNDLLTDSTPPAVKGDAAKHFAVGETKYEYTDDRELAAVQRSDGRNVEYTYDSSNGRLKTVALTGTKISYGYDSAGVLTSASRSDGAKVKITHDGPLWTGTTWSGAIDGSVTASYDADFRVSKLTVNAQSSATFGYDKDGLVTSATANKQTLELTRDVSTGFVTGTSLGTVSTSHSYSGFGELKKLSAQVQGQTGFSQKLERDSLGRITKITETLGSDKHITTYSYDELGRLVEATRDDSTNQYSYDTNGNRKKLTVDGDELASGKYDAQDRIQSYGDITYEATPHGDLLRETYPAGALELTYDELGNLQNATLSNDNDSYSVDYVMDGFGRRVARRVNGDFDRAWLYQDDLRPIAEIDSDGTFSQFIYTDAAQSVPDFILRAGTPLRVVKDYLGSVRLVVNAQSGKIEQELEYDEFGNVTNDTQPGFQPFGFAGGLYDSDTRLVRFGARDYDAVTGRWVAKDPLGFGGGDTNLYVYCGNDPVNCVDPDGREPTPFVRWLQEQADTWFEIAGENWQNGDKWATVGPAAMGALVEMVPMAMTIAAGGETGTSNGTLTVAESEELQAIANDFKTEIDVVGSRAAGKGRNIETDLPVGKGSGTRSDIDVRIDGQRNIDSRGALADRVIAVGKGAGSVASEGLPLVKTRPPFIRFTPKKP
jgi:RHS repeat-associated protein